MYEEGSPYCLKYCPYDAKKNTEKPCEDALSQEPTYYPPCIDCNKKMDEIRRAYDKLKEQEPCDDAISRENTLKAMIKQLGIRNENYLLPAEETLYKVVKNMPPVTPHQKMGCEGCIYEKTGNNSTYPCSHCSRCYTDKYKAERSSKE